MDFPKVPLTDVCLYPRSLYEVLQKSDLVLTFTVKNYSRLEKNKIYYRCTSSHDRRWTIKIVLKQKIIFVFLFTNLLSEKVQIRILRVGKAPEQQIELTMTEVIAQQLFVSEFCNIDILDPKNEYLHDDKLIIQCKYEENEYESVWYDTIYDEMSFEKDAYEISKDMLDLYRTGLYSDFCINVEGTTFWVHKSILAARSKYFADLFTSNHTIDSETLSGTANAMHEVLIFIYSGELRVLTIPEMLDAWQIAEKLEMIAFC